jgi:hypothetical protein
MSSRVFPSLSALFRFLASLKLAVTLLISLAIILGIATYIESIASADEARRLVYQTWWFSFVLIILAINVAFAALSRLPWKRRHVGFVVTHAGIILVLAGSLITQRWGFEGQMALVEGEQSSALLLGESLLEVTTHGSEDAESSEMKLLSADAFKPGSRFELGHGTTATVLEYYRNAVDTEEVSPYGNEPNPAIHFGLKGSRAEVSEWLFARDPNRRSLELGPANVVFLEVSSEDEWDQLLKSGDDPDAQSGMLVLKREGQTYRIPVQLNVGKTVLIGEGPYSVTITRFLPDSIVEAGKLVNRSIQPINPACEILIEGEGVKEKHTLFSLFPDFPSLHGRAESESLFETRFVMGRTSFTPGPNQLIVVKKHTGELYYRLHDGGEVTAEGSLVQGQRIETGWMDFKFLLKHYFPTARLESVYEPARTKADPASYPPAAKLWVQRGLESDEFWMGQGSSRSLILEGHHIHLAFGVRSYPLDFSIELKDFEIERYRGTDRPASFMSRVILSDPSFEKPIETEISMNQPLKHDGFTFFQASYRETPGEPDMSVFAVTRDPGIPLKYGGSLVLIGGIMTMFYTRRFSSTQKQISEDDRD